MKEILISCCFLLFLFSASAQQDSIYQTLLAKAGLLHLQKNYEPAIELYEQAFEIKKPDALSAYKAAGMYALDSNAEKSLQYLSIALEAGWTESDRLVVDPYFDYLRLKSPKKWKAIEQKAVAADLQYAKSLKLAALRNEINLMTLRDQQYRYLRAQRENDSLAVIIDQQIRQADIENLNRARSIIKQFGWPKLSEVGKDGQNNFSLIVQHADHDVWFQQTALQEMEKLKNTKELNLENYAFLYDRVQCNLNYKQLYGTQVVWTRNGEASGYRPILEEDKVNVRRKELGLLPLQIYSLNYGFNFQLPDSTQARQKDSLEMVKVQGLIDSAKLHYSNNEFSKTYDYYNAASTFLGGMSNADNFEAAIIFSRISAIDTSSKYKSIALDFLNLLYLRKELTKSRLLAQPAFTPLYNEQRWMDLTKDLPL